MLRLGKLGIAPAVVAVSFLGSLAIGAVPAQDPDASSVIQHIDAAAQTRFDSIEEFTVTEHYALFRGSDEVHPAAEMTVETTYRKGAGKSYAVRSETGSEILRKFVLRPLLDNEKSINQPGNVQKSWFTSANYEMKLKPGGVQLLDGRDCLALAITPRRKAPNMIEGTLWVDVKDDSIVQIEGTATKSPSMWTGPTKMMRRYKNVSGFAMSSHARAETTGLLVGRTVLTIDYTKYRIRLLPAR